jgi:RHS repeat-associated protein
LRNQVEPFAYLRDLLIRRAQRMTERYLSGPSASGVDTVLAEEDVTSLSSPGTVTWPLTDNLGTVRDIVDSTGAVIDHLVYSSFGQIAHESASTVHHPQGYTGSYYDPDTGMVNDFHRWYDPATRQWLSLDPKGFAAGDANLYRYVSNSPNDNIDPTGLGRRPPFGGPVPAGSQLCGTLFDPNSPEYKRFMQELGAPPGDIRKQRQRVAKELAEEMREGDRKAIDNLLRIRNFLNGLDILERSHAAECERWGLRLRYRLGTGRGGGRLGTKDPFGEQQIDIIIGNGSDEGDPLPQRGKEGVLPED